MLKNNIQHIKKLLFLVIGIILLNIVGSYFYKRFDLTQDKRYTLSEAAKKTIEDVDSPILVDVFLEGNFPPEFNRLQIETKQLLEEFSASNSKIRYEFINPLENEEDADAIREQLVQFGLIPAQVEVKQNGKEVPNKYTLGHLHTTMVKL